MIGARNVGSHCRRLVRQCWYETNRKSFYIDPTMKCRTVSPVASARGKGMRRDKFTSDYPIATKLVAPTLDAGDGTISWTRSPRPATTHCASTARTHPAAFRGRCTGRSSPLLWRLAGDDQQVGCTEPFRGKRAREEVSATA